MRSFGWILLLGVVAARPASGQANAVALRGRWAVGASLGSASFWGATRETIPTEDGLAFAPYHSTLWGIGVAFGKERLRIGVAARYGQPGVRIRGSPPGEDGEPGSAVNVVVENAYRLTTLTASLSTRFRQLQSGPALRASLGVGVERWSSPGSQARTLGAGQLGLAAEVSLGGGFVAALTAELGFTPKSPFRADELPEGFEPRSTWRRALHGAVYLRF